MNNKRRLEKLEAGISTVDQTAVEIEYVVLHEDGSEIVFDADGKTIK